MFNKNMHSSCKLCYNTQAWKSQRFREEIETVESNRVSTFNFKRQVVQTEYPAYPELHPVSEKAFQRPVHSRHKKHVSRSQYVLYVLINAALLFGLVQCVRALVVDALELSSLVQSKASVQAYYAQTRQEHRALNDKIRVYSSPSGIEELARNYLNMVGENELPVRFQ